MSPQLTDKQREEFEQFRPTWMKWFYDKWAEATVYFDAEQKGWYMNLLMYAASNGSPPGYIEADETRLKEIANYKPIPDYLLDILTKIFNNDSTLISEYTDQVAQLRQERWLKVRQKFVESKKYEGCVFNRKLVETLEEAYHNRQTRKIAGKAGAKSRWTQTKQNKELNGQLLRLPFKNTKTAETGQDVNTSEQSQLMTTAMEDAFAIKEEKQYANTENASAINSEQTEEFTLISPDSRTRNARSSFSNNISSKRTDIVVKDSSSDINSSKRNIKRRESIFNEKKFKITEDMRIHLENKFPDFTDGDFEYLSEKFKLVFHGKKYISWKRTFYNFVTNQVVNYNYTAGDFQKLSQRGKKKERSIQHESAADKSARLEQEADEYTSSLLSSSDGDSERGEETLSLTADDYG